MTDGNICIISILLPFFPASLLFIGNNVYFLRDLVKFGNVSIKFLIWRISYNFKADFLMQLIIFFGCTAYGILVPQSGVEPISPVLEAQSLNHWTSREVPAVANFKRSIFLLRYNSYKIKFIHLKSIIDKVVQASSLSNSRTFSSPPEDAPEHFHHLLKTLQYIFITSTSSHSPFLCPPQP